MCRNHSHATVRPLCVSGKAEIPGQWYILPQGLTLEMPDGTKLTLRHSSVIFLPLSTLDALRLLTDRVMEGYYIPSSSTTVEELTLTTALEMTSKNTYGYRPHTLQNGEPRTTPQMGDDDGDEELPF